MQAWFAGELFSVSQRDQMIDLHLIFVFEQNKFDYRSCLIQNLQYLYL